MNYHQDGMTFIARDEETKRVLMAASAMREALREIAEGRGRFNRDPLIHAGNTIEDMKKLAVDALAKTLPP